MNQSHWTTNDAVDVAIYSEGTYPYLTGGVSTVIHQIIRGLPDLSFGVVWIGPTDRNLPAQKKFAVPANVRWIKHLPPVKKLGVGWDRQHVPDFPKARIHHAHTAGFAGFAAAIARAQQPGSRMILSEHSLYVRDVIAAMNEGPAHWGMNEVPMPPERSSDRESFTEAIRRQARAVYENADIVTYLSDTLRKEAREYGVNASKTRILPNGVDVQRFMEIKPLRQDNAPLRIMCLGRIVPVKGIETALAALQILIERNLQVHLEITGPSDEAPCYLELCRQISIELGVAAHVSFNPPTAPERALRKADILLMTSRSEAMPMVILEAMAAGVPVCALDTGCIASMLEGAGLVVPQASGDNDSRTFHILADALQNFIEDKALRKRCAEKGRQRVKEHFSLDLALKRWRALYGDAGLDGGPPQ